MVEEQRETGNANVETDEKNGDQIWLEVFKKQIKEKMKRYMERQRDDPGTNRTGLWGDNSSGRKDKDRDDVMPNSKTKSEYITRLTSLRDSLINQEEANLAQALDRLRVHSISNKTHSKRLRMHTIDDVLSAPPLIHQRKNMVTTVERFRQMRPSRHQPVIFPLQGRQMLDMTSPRPASEEPISNFGNSTNRSTRSFHAEHFAAKPSHSKLDETVQTNLQRLIQRTSSIPNIGRKALRNQDGLEPRAKPLLNIRASLQKAHGHHLASPFLLSTHEDCDPDSPQARSSGEWGVASLSPHAHKLSPVLQGDTIDMDKLSQYYQKLICDMAPEMDAEGEEGDGKRKGKGNHGCHGNDEGAEIEAARRYFLYKQKYRHSPYKTSLSKGHNHNNNSTYNGSDPGKKHYNSYNSVVSSAGKTIPFSDLPNIAARSGTVYTYHADVTDDVEAMDNATTPSHHRHFPEVPTAYRFQMGHGGASDVGSTTSEISKWYGGRSVYHDKLSKAGDNSDMMNSTKEGKMKIVVDMPNIIFNAASPDADTSSVTDVIDRGSGLHRSNSGQSLKKTVKQHELRQRELHNLLEDVKELNSWSEIAAKRSISEGT